MPGPRQKVLSLAPGTYERLNALKAETSDIEDRKITFSELIDRLMKEHRDARREDS